MLMRYYTDDVGCHHSNDNDVTVSRDTLAYRDLLNAVASNKAYIGEYQQRLCTLRNGCHKQVETTTHFDWSVPILYKN